MYMFVYVILLFPLVSSFTRCCCIDGKYHLLPNGDLLIHNLEYNDRFASYRCRTMHKLSRLVVISNPSKIIINGKKGLKHDTHFSLFEILIFDIFLFLIFSRPVSNTYSINIFPCVCLYRA